MRLIIKTAKTAFCLSIFLWSNHAVHAQSTTAVSDTITLQHPDLAKAVTVSGRILDASTGASLAGINVKYKNFSAAITDSVGNFSLKVPSYNVTIIAESEGYQTKEVALKGRRAVTVSVYEDRFNSLYDLANTPAGFESRARLPYAATSVQTNGWSNSFETPDSYLQGRVAGLNAIRRSGTPNIGANLFLRGYTSLYATNQPLIVVDGVIYDNNDYGSSVFSNHYTNPLAYLDMKDIDNITVLKDGSSIYGTKGANGVIMITTARARELATRIDFGAYGGVNFAPSALPVLNADEYRTHLSKVLQSGGMTNEQIQALPYMHDNLSNPSYYRYHYKTDWQNEVLNNSYAQNVYLKVTGGDNIAKYGLSIGQLNNSGVIRNTDLGRSSMRFNADLNLSKRMTAFANVSFIRNVQDLVNQGMNAKLNPLYIGLVKAPFLAVKEVSDAGIEAPVFADKDTFNVSNPAVLVNNTGQSKSYRFFGSIGFNYNIARNFILSNTAGLTIDKIRETVFIPRRGVVDDTLLNAIGDSRSASQVKRLFSLYNDISLNYNKDFNNVHHLSGRAGLRYLMGKTESDLGIGYNTPTDEFKTLNSGIPLLRQVGGGIGEWRWTNAYFGADYSLLDKYFISLNVAMDGSSRFGTNPKVGKVSIGNNNFALLSSIAGAWLISSEDFFANSNTIELLKLRASYGASGNDDIGNYAARQYYVAQNFLGVQGLVRGNIGNPSLQWERVDKFNTGVDVSLFKERLNLSLDVFSNRTRRMLINEPTANPAGVVFAVSNSGSMRTTGLEASISSRIINNAIIKWDLGLNIARYKSTIATLPTDRIITNYGGAVIITKEGEVANQFFGYRTNGVFASDAEAASASLYKRLVNGSIAAFKGGDVRFIDMNGDSFIDESDRAVIGNPNPDFFGAITNHLEWKNLSLDLLFNFSKGGEVYNYLRNQLESGSGYNNQTLAVRNRWAKDGDITNMPKATFGDPMGNSHFSDRWIEDGSYLRLKTASLTYKLPIKPGFIRYTIVYITGNNLFTVTKYLGYDPEFSSSTNLLGQGIDLGLEPQFRSTQLGVRIGL